MRFASQNLQPFQLNLVTVTRTGQCVNSNLGNAESPFEIHRPSVPVLIKTGDYYFRYPQSTRFIEVTLVLTKADLETLYRMVSATDLGYKLLLSLPLLNVSWTVTAEVLTDVITVGADTYYTISFFDTPINVGWWQKFKNRFSGKKDKKMQITSFNPNANLNAASP